jgi:hypothetical protein
MVTVYNQQRLHGSRGHITPLAILQGRQDAIQAACDRKLDAACRRREQDAQKTAHFYLALTECRDSVLKL